MSVKCFLVDENVPFVIPMQLKQIEPAIQIYTIGDGTAPEKGTADLEILSWIEANSCLLKTNNRATMPVHLHEHLANGGHILGIIQLPRRINVGTILEELLLIYLASEPDEFKDQILYLPLRTQG